MKALGKMSSRGPCLASKAVACAMPAQVPQRHRSNTAWTASKFSPLVGAIGKFTKENQLSMKSIAKVTEQDFSHATEGF